MKTTLSDIAKATGYSISTVSRALSGSDKISMTTRKQIFKAANELNYPLYVNPDGNKFPDDIKLHFVITGFHQGEFYASFFHGISKAMQKRSIHLSLVTIQKPFEDFLLNLKELSTQEFDGLVLYTPAFDQKEYEDIKNVLPEDYPVVSNHLVENPVFSTVTFDTYSGGYLAAEHFSGKGYATCGIIEGPVRKAGSRNRANGFKDFIRQNPKMELIWEYVGDLSFDSGVAAFNEFDALKTKPEAVFACNDVMAHAFLQEALLKNYNVPKDIAVVGYDDLPICMRHKPSISSIHTDYEKLGTITVDKMKELVSKSNQVRGIVSFVPVSLVARESS